MYQRVTRRSLPCRDCCDGVERLPMRHRCLFRGRRVFDLTESSSTGPGRGTGCGSWMSGHLRVDPAPDSKHSLRLTPPPCFGYTGRQGDRHGISASILDRYLSWMSLPWRNVETPERGLPSTPLSGRSGRACQAPRNAQSFDPLREIRYSQNLIAAASQGFCRAGRVFAPARFHIWRRCSPRRRFGPRRSCAR